MWLDFLTKICQAGYIIQQRGDKMRQARLTKFFVPSEMIYRQEDEEILLTIEDLSDDLAYK